MQTSLITVVCKKKTLTNKLPNNHDDNHHQEAI